MIDLRQEYFVGGLSMFLRSNRFKNEKIAILMILRSFLFNLKASYRFLISTCNIAHLHDFTAENMIPDLLSSAISI